jgi:hypothetical protein
MIVRDEESIITRALESVINIITSFYIYDTGSKDNTKNIILDWMKNNNIPGELDETEWKNFGYNKSLLFHNARYHKNEIISSAEYFIWLDADEVFITNINNQTSYFNHNDSLKLYKELNDNKDSSIFFVKTYYGNLKYNRWNLCRNNQLYKWEQPVHEYLVGTENNNSYNITWFYLLARKEGNSSKNPNRYENDAKMFLEYLVDNPNEPRATFYLAQTYESLNTELAIEYYKKRIELTNGFNEERYISCLRLGRILKDYYEKIKYLLKGTEIVQERIECYYELLMLEYSKDNYLKGAGWGLMAPLTREVKDSYLFSEPAKYDYLFDLNFSVCCFHAKYYEEGYNACLRIINNTNNNSDQIELAKKNLNFFLPHVNKIQNNFCPPRQEIIVIENFYENPDAVRKDALEAVYPVKGNFPGQRSESKFYGDMKAKFENIIGRKIKYWPTGGYNGSFQYVLESNRSWIHRDLTEWSAVIFLTPNAPKNGGTKFYNFKKNNQTYSLHDEMENEMSENAHNEDAWDLVDVVGNNYNRCVLFRGKRSHISDKYFGTDINTARLFQTFFFDD